MAWLIDPFETAFFWRALVGGALAASICAIAGAWVISRGMTFLGEALGHGMLPGVALASLFGLSPLVGAAASAAVMGGLVGLLSRRSRLANDTSIGVAFVAMLSIGVIIVSWSGSFATDVTVMLFGDILAIREGDLVVLVVGLVLTVAFAAVLHRPLTAAAFDDRVASTLGLRPGLARIGLVGLVILAVVASYHAVGTLLVMALLVAPAAAAAVWVRSIAAMMFGGTFFGIAAVFVGLLVSWHAGTAAGATVSLTSIVLLAVSWTARRGVGRAAGGVDAASAANVADAPPPLAATSRV